MSYGDTSRPWVQIDEFHAGIARSNPAFADLAQLAMNIAASPYPAAGLCGMTSMHDLIVGMSRCIRESPHLVIAYDFDSQLFRFSYRDGSAKPWSRSARADEVYAVFERFVTKRARWFRSALPA